MFMRKIVKNLLLERREAKAFDIGLNENKSELFRFLRDKVN